MSSLKNKRSHIMRYIFDRAAVTSDRSYVLEVQNRFSCFAYKLVKYHVAVN